MPSSPLIHVSKSTIFPDRKSNLGDLKLSVSDLPMLSCHYIQKGCLFPRPSIPIHLLLSLLKQSLSKTLSFFPPLAGRLYTDPNGSIYIACNDAGVEFHHSTCATSFIRDVIAPVYVPELVNEFFSFDKTVSYQGHFKPIMAIQFTELPDGIFIGCSINHAVTDGTSFWNFFNTYAEICRKISNNDPSIEKISRQPEFSRDSVLISSAILKVPKGGPKVTFNVNEPLRERIFSFCREAILELKAKANSNNKDKLLVNEDFNAFEKCYFDKSVNLNGIFENWLFKSSNIANTAEISSFQSLSALLWRAPLRERIFSFCREAILELKAKANSNNKDKLLVNEDFNAFEKCYFDKSVNLNGIFENWLFKSSNIANTAEISSFQSLSALLWRAVTRARKLPVSKTTTFRTAVNCRHRLNPKLDPLYFGNAIQSIPTYAVAGDVTSRDLRWCAERLNESVEAHKDERVRGYLKEWEKDPRCFPLGNFDETSMTMGSSPRFPMYENDFGWGRPLAIRSGGANKFDGKISAFPGREGMGGVDLEVVLAPETMAAIESDPEFMQYVMN
ncbi:hypothetical protein GOBAR_AA18488 [Gossypium barbadense]|uniref:Uncharacterized protein n=1 Tax=Gossypium barbadense TaxID=3634 RepID=A0A2P5XFP7_GOSBA|nr:hypothetical protein GOBAR_AA18488 [Gossypium barbadense]